MARRLLVPARSLAALLLATTTAITITTCGGGGSSPAPAPTPTRANITASFASIAGDRQAPGGFVYTVVLQLRETGGIAATISAIDLTFLNGSTAFGSTHFESPMSDSSNRVAANGTATSKRLISTDSDPTSVYATNIRATVTFMDDARNNGTATATENVPALPPAPQAFSLSGSVLEIPGNFPVRAARVDVKDGANAGAAVLSDDGGRFTFGSLVAGTFTLAVSKTEYDTLQQTVTLSSNTTLILSVRKSANPQPGPPPNLCGPAVAACGQATARCNDGTLSCSKNRQGTCSSHGGVACWICPGPLCSVSSSSGTSDLSLDRSLPQIVQRIR